MLGFEYMRIHPAYADTLAACGLDQTRAVFERIDGDVVAWSRTTDTLHVACPTGGPGFFLKRYAYPSWHKRWRGALRGTLLGAHRGKAEYDLLSEMRALGIPAVRPVAYGCRREAGFAAACFLVTEAVPGACNLTTFASDVRDGRRHLSAVQRRQMLEHLARAIARLHATGFAHGQLYWRNILVRTDANGDPEYFFLDPRPRRGARWVRRQRDWWLDELTQVSASAQAFTTRGERVQFLEHYLAERRVQLDIRDLLRRIVRRSRHWAPHEAQRLRMSELFAAWSRELASEDARDGAAS